MSDTPTSGVTLETYFETGDVPTQSQFSDFIASYENKVDANLITGNTAALLAVYPSTQGTATLLTGKMNRVTNATAGVAGVILPTALQGNIVYIAFSAAYPVNVYPASGESFVGMAVNLPSQFQDGEAVIIFCVNDGVWNIVPCVFAEYKTRVYRALLSQAGVAAPTAVILENSLDLTPTFSYVGAGNYTLTATGVLTSGKMVATTQAALTGGYWCSCNSLASPNTLQIETFNNIGIGSNARLNSTPIEILIYP